MEELKAEQPSFLQILMSLHHHAQLGAACACAGGLTTRTVAVATACKPSCCVLSAGLINTGRCQRTGPWLECEGPIFREDRFMSCHEERGIRLGHYGERCPKANLARSFTLVDSNGIHATAISFCRCKRGDGSLTADYQQLLRAGIFPAA
ncbi:hypothetical protein K438DRAFT_730104 [Mycena galopus ATCC 62051]|nr:hypothetical protein K438DRAFT_730104 [Mycena galopus ATCC 62051]